MKRASLEGLVRYRVMLTHFFYLIPRALGPPRPPASRGKYPEASAEALTHFHLACYRQYICIFVAIFGQPDRSPLPPTFFELPNLVGLAEIVSLSVAKNLTGDADRQGAKGKALVAEADGGRDDAAARGLGENCKTIVILM